VRAEHASRVAEGLVGQADALAGQATAARDLQ
jgi:hypothetical protein